MARDNPRPTAGAVAGGPRASRAAKDLLTGPARPTDYDAVAGVPNEEACGYAFQRYVGNVSSDGSMDKPPPSRRSAPFAGLHRERPEE